MVLSRKNVEHYNVFKADIFYFLTHCDKFCTNIGTIFEKKVLAHFVSEVRFCFSVYYRPTSAMQFFQRAALQVLHKYVRRNRFGWH